MVRLHPLPPAAPRSNPEHIIHAFNDLIDTNNRLMNLSFNFENEQKIENKMKKFLTNFRKKERENPQSPICLSFGGKPNSVVIEGGSTTRGCKFKSQYQVFLNRECNS